MRNEARRSARGWATAVLPLAWLLLWPLPVRAADLMDLYRLAREQDPAFTAARHALEAVRQRLPQARAGLLPSVALSGGNSRNRSDVDFGQETPTQDRNIRSWNWNLQLTQPILRLPSHHAVDEAESLAEQAQAQFDAAEQELLLRVTQAYFDIASAEEAIAVADAQVKAMGEQLALAKRGVESGTGTITEVHEARARGKGRRTQRTGRETHGTGEDRRRDTGNLGRARRPLPDGRRPETATE
jgi:outer membrane protein